MRSKLTFLALGFIAGIASIVGTVAIVLFIGNDPTITTHDTKLSSGKTVKVSMCNLVWGVGHDATERDAKQDQFELEFVSALHQPDDKARDQEVWEAFELIRSVSEQWGIRKATVAVFPTAVRKGRYEIYAFQQADDGKWSASSHSAKVHIND